MATFNTNIPTLNKFLGKFDTLFSKKQFIAFSFFVYGFFMNHKRNSIQAIAYESGFDYQALQYFFSESKWDTDKLNNQRVQIIQKNPATASTTSGILAIDDTGCPKPHAKNTQGAQFQYCGAIKRKEICNIAVTSAFASKSKSFIVNNKSYKPESEFIFGKEDVEFKSKIKLAEELVTDAVDKGIKFSAVVSDSWYASAGLIEFIHSKNLTYIAEVRANRDILFYHPKERKHCFVKQDELVKLVKKHYAHKIKFFHRTLTNGKKVSIPVYTFKSRFKNCDVPVKIVIVMGKWLKKDEEEKNFHILFSTDTSMHFDRIINYYLMRWSIEYLFRQLKDIFYFDHYQVRHQEQIQRYWTLSILALSMLYWIKQTGCLAKIVPKKLVTFNDHRNIIKDLIELDTHIALSKSSALMKKHYPVKSKRLYNHLHRQAA